MALIAAFKIFSSMAMGGTKSCNDVSESGSGLMAFILLYYRDAYGLE